MKGSLMRILIGCALGFAAALAIPPGVSAAERGVTYRNIRDLISTPIN